MPIKNLVFSGAEIRGISYIGIIRAIEELNMYENIENILGVSSGAIFAITLVLGLSSHQLETIVMSLSIGQLFDFNTENILNIIETFGVDNGDKIIRIFKILFKKILKNENATFKDLYHFTNNTKNLIITGTNLCKKKAEYFSYETTPDMPLYIALRLSTSIPFCYQSVTYNNQVYIDGAFSNNFPINFFKDNIENTLGIIISGANECNEKISTLGDYMYNITECVLGIMPNYLKELYKKNIIEIRVNYTVLDMKFNRDVKKLLIEEGYNEFKNKYKQLFGDTTSNDTTISEIRSITENVDDIIKDMNREIEKKSLVKDNH